MSEAQKEVLKMLADKVITVEEAERLLRSLEQAEKQHRDTETSSPRSHRSINAAIDSVGEVLATIGPMVKEAVGEAVSGAADVGFGLSDNDDDDLDPVEPMEGQFPLEEGSVLIIRNNRRRERGGGDLIIEGVSGSLCEIISDEASGVRVGKDSSRAVVRWSTGILRVKVPETVKRLKAMTLGGDVQAHNLVCEASIKTMGGNIEMSGLAGEFTGKTMGGNISLDLVEAMRGGSKAVTMGGNIDVQVPPNIKTQVQAVSMSGRISVEETVGTVTPHRTLVKHRMEIAIGEGEPESTLHLKTMGGDISLRRDTHE